MAMGLLLGLVTGSVVLLEMHVSTGEGGLAMRGSGWLLLGTLLAVDARMSDGEEGPGLLLRLALVALATVVCCHFFGDAEAGITERMTGWLLGWAAGRSVLVVRGPAGPLVPLALAALLTATGSNWEVGPLVLAGIGALGLLLTAWHGRVLPRD